VADNNREGAAAPEAVVAHVVAAVAGVEWSASGEPGWVARCASSTRRYSLTFSVNARNVLIVYRRPIGVWTPDSTTFGRSVSLAGGPFSNGPANRKIELQAMFSF